MRIQNPRRPKLVTAICYYLMLQTLISIYSLISAKRIIGAENYYICIVTSVVSTILLIVVTIGLWKMRKSAAYLLIGYFLLNFIYIFFLAVPLGIVDPNTYQIAEVLFQIINLASCFYAISYVIINNPKDASSLLKHKQFGIIASIIGIILLIVSQTADFTKTQTSTYDTYDLNKSMGLPDAFNNHMLNSDTKTYTDTTTKNIILFSGLAILLGGCLLYGFTLNKNIAPAETSKGVLGNHKTNLSSNETMTQIERLNDLRQKGILTEEEFSDKKSELLKKI